MIPVRGLLTGVDDVRGGSAEVGRPSAGAPRVGAEGVGAGWERGVVGAEEVLDRHLAARRLVAHQGAHQDGREGAEGLRHRGDGVLGLEVLDHVLTHGAQEHLDDLGPQAVGHLAGALDRDRQVHVGSLEGHVRTPGVGLRPVGPRRGLVRVGLLEQRGEVPRDQAGDAAVLVVHPLGEVVGVVVLDLAEGLDGPLDGRGGEGERAGTTHGVSLCSPVCHL